jgi:LacI family transcriptional regulator
MLWQTPPVNDDGPPDPGAPPAGARRRRPTMVDVAELAGVSLTTVSFVINGRGHGCSTETRRRVLQAVESLGYRPNRAAQTMRTRRTRTIGFVTDEIAVKAPAGDTISGAHDVAREQGSMMLIVHATRATEYLQTAVEDLVDRQVDAIIYAVVGTERATLPELLKQLPTVLVNCFVADDSFPSIVPDEERGGRAATTLALEAGHRRVAFIAGDAQSWAAQRRMRGYRKALCAAGLDVDDALIRYGNYRADSGYELAREVLARKHRPTAILCGNDLMAVGAYFAAKESGLEIPTDVTIVGYDNMDALAADVSPPLTTVQLPYYEMGRWAAEQVLNGSVDTLPARTYAPCQIVRRGSVAVPPRRP